MESVVKHSFVGAAATQLPLVFAPQAHKQKAWMIAGLIAVAMLAYEVPRTAENLFDVLEAPINADKNELHTAYRNASKKHHPDKNGDPEMFIKVKRAYEILSSDKQRTGYYRFGDQPYEDPPALVMLVFLSVLAHVLATAVAFLLCFPKALRSAKMHMVIYVLGCICFEFYARFNDSSLPYISSYMLPFEQIELLKRIFPGLMCLAALYSRWKHVDQDAVVAYLMRGILQTNHAIVTSIEQLKEEIHAKGRGSQGGVTQPKLESASVRVLSGATGVRQRKPAKGGGEALEQQDESQGQEEQLTNFVTSLSEDQKRGFKEILESYAQQNPEAGKKSGLLQNLKSYFVPALLIFFYFYNQK